MEQAYKRLPPDVLYKMRLLRLDTDEEGTMKFASFSSQVEKEVEDKYICKLLPHTLALAALFSALRNAQSIPKHDLIIERSPNQCYLLKFIKDTDRNRSIFRQNFLVYIQLVVCSCSMGQSRRFLFLYAQQFLLLNSNP